MLARELRSKYIAFFQSKGHLHLPGSPLTPVDALGAPDNSTLFTSAGMQQFKPYFIGAATPPSTRIVTVQKCVRTGDIDSVGDFSHCTFFEMLGNFSFGDYFKAEVIPWTWEFLTKEIGLDPERLCVTVYLDDDEAYEIWNKVVGLPEDRIHRLGEDKNYWPANAISEGPNGPCGPCSEIFYRTAPLEEMTNDPNLTPTERFKKDDAAGRWLEIWNNVFTQFNRSEDENGAPTLTPLPRKNNDTGAGLDRIVMILQGKKSVFETDLFASTLAKIEEISGLKYEGSASQKDFAFRVVAEHTRSMVFCIADGILPSNEGRGYVLRRIMRRAIRFGKTVLGFDAPFIDKLAPCIIENMGDFYPELNERKDHILRTIHAEEVRFRHTLDKGMQIAEEMLANSGDTLRGEDVFTLYDTYGFPVELTREICAERNISMDMEGFEKAMKAQRERSREATEIDKDVFRDMGDVISEVQRTLPPTIFHGYHETVTDSVILAILKDGELVDFIRSGDVADLVLDRTPFYAESGGQVGDTGWIMGIASDVTCQLKLEVLDTRKAGGVYLHRVKVLEGEAATDRQVHAQVDVKRRRAIMRNHTSTHLLQAALRHILGAHVHQKGSMVAPDRLRFDFTHTQPVTETELEQVEEMVNGWILEDREVEIHTDVPLDQARAKGAMALFGEKYGDRVRMVEIPECSLELCGGTHLSRTSQAVLFKILSETGVAAGVRRIEAITGESVYRYLKAKEETIQTLARTLKTNPRDIEIAVDKMVAQKSVLEKQLRQMREAGGDQDSLNAEEINGVKWVIARIPNADQPTLAAIANRLAKKHESVAVLLGSVQDGKVFLTALATQDLVQKGVHAGTIVREVAKIAGGGGGGRPDFAQAGGKSPERIEEALKLARELAGKIGA